MAVDAAREENLINTGTALGMSAYFDYLTTRGYGRPSTVDPWRSATKQVFVSVEGTDEYGDVDVRALDLDEYLGRFETLARGSLKAESIQTYRSRFTRAVETYREFLESGRPPSFRSPRTKRNRPAEGTVAGTAAPEDPRPGVTPLVATPTVGGGGLIDYPFPLQSGQVAYVRLPVRVNKSDIDRLNLFLRSLVLEPQGALPEGAPSSGRNQGGSDQ